MSHPIALLVVHGIGSQKPGESLGSCVRELHQAYPQATLTDREGDPLTAGERVTRGLPEAVLRLGSWKVHFYEVYWADRLAGEPVGGSFHKFLFEETTWFPWLNWKAGLLPADDYSWMAVWARTVQLWLGQLGSVSCSSSPNCFPRENANQCWTRSWRTSGTTPTLCEGCSPPGLH